MKKPIKFSTLLIYGLIIAMGVSLLVRYLSPAQTPTVTYSQMVDQFLQENVESFTVQDNVVTMKLYQPIDGADVVATRVVDFSVFYADFNGLIHTQASEGIIKSYDYPPNTEPSLIETLLPYLILGLLFMLMLFIVVNRANGSQSAMKFSKAGARLAKDKDKVTFLDVAGAEEEKAELAELVDYLKDPAKYSKLGAKIPKGVLLVGPPGTGKTLIARAVAGEAGVHFLSISASEFVEVYVGVGASRVRDLFDQAKKLSPSIIFIDEIDAVGRKRGAGLGGGHDEREQTLNQLLVEMDGFEKNSGVIVMAATNRKDILDNALLRPGRFDREIYIGAPDARGREAILKVHAKDKPLAEDVNLNTIARATTGFTGADLANLLNEAALLSARQNLPCITMPVLEEAIMKVIAGPEKHSQRMTEHERKLTAFHEAGHAVAMYHLPTCDPVHHITIIPRGGSGGMTVSIPKEDTFYASKQEMYETVVSFLGGRVAEQLRFQDVTTGASNDIERATGIARDMVARYGMSDRLGTVSYADGNEIFVGRDYEKTRAYSEQTAGTIDEEVHAIMTKAYSQCTQLLTEFSQQLDAVAQYLLEHERMSQAQFLAVMENREIPTETTGIIGDFEESE